MFFGHAFGVYVRIVLFDNFGGCRFAPLAAKGDNVQFDLLSVPLLMLLDEIENKL